MSNIVQALFVSAGVGCGGWLLLSARVREDSDDLHCLWCGYNLTGLTSDRCPECGAAMSAESCCHGPPSRMRWGRFVAGAVLVCGPAAVVVLRYFGSL